MKIIPRHRVTPDHITQLLPNERFTFASNLAGRHGKGAAKEAKIKYGACNGMAFGPQGRSYAIPTKDGRIGHDDRVQITLPLPEIATHVQRYLSYCKTHPELTFLTTQIGCGNAGLTPEQVAPLFEGAVALENVKLPARFWAVLGYQAH